jgi:hypothetical protein
VFLESQCTFCTNGFQIQQDELDNALEYIGKLEKENEELKAKLKALHQRQFKSNNKRKQKSSENSAHDKSAAGKKKNRGAP